MNKDLRETALTNIENLNNQLQELPKTLKAVQAQHKEKRDALVKEAGIFDALEDLDNQLEGFFKQLQSSADQIQGQLKAWTEVAAWVAAEEGVEDDVVEDDVVEDDVVEEQLEAEPVEAEADPEPEMVNGVDVSRLNEASRMQVLAGNPETIAILKEFQNQEESEWEDEGEDLIDQMDEVDAILEGVRVAPESEDEPAEPDEFDVDDFFGDEGEEGSPVEALVERYRSDRSSP